MQALLALILALAVFAAFALFRRRQETGEDRQSAVETHGWQDFTSDGGDDNGD